VHLRKGKGREKKVNTEGGKKNQYSNRILQNPKGKKKPLALLDRHKNLQTLKKIGLSGHF